MVVVLAVQKCRHYLIANNFTVISDQKALKFLIEQREVQPQFKRWLIKLLGYDFEILYQLGLNNKAADALSRVNLNGELHSLIEPPLLDTKPIQREVEEDAELQEIVSLLKRT